jgi:aspartate dehydrogenase
MKIGIIGLGTIGGSIIEQVISAYRSSLEGVYIYDSKKSSIDLILSKYSWIESLESMEQVVSNSDFIIEAASCSAVRELMPLVVKRKKDVLIMSTGGLLKVKDLLLKAREMALEVIIPHGAIAGLDAIEAIRDEGIDKIRLSSYKPIKALENSPYVVKNNIDLKNFSGQKLFKGGVAEATEGFPKSINVSATLLLISGLEDIEVNICVSEDENIITHIIEVESKISTLKFECRNFPSQRNPKTSALAISSAVAEVKRHIKKSLK